MSTANKAEALKQLQRNFQGGANLDTEVLESVLEMFNNNVKEATAFLQSQNQNDYIDPGPQNGPGGALPADFMKKPAGWSIEKVKGQANKVHPANEMKEFFLKENSTFVEHLNLQKTNYPVYVPVLLQLLHHGVDLNQTAKAKILAAAWARHDFKLAHHCLYFKEEVFGFPEILRALKILDAPRKIRALEKRLQRLQTQGTAKPKTVGLTRSKINDLKRDTPEDQTTSVTGCLAKKVRSWVGTIAREKLEFFALQMPKEPWQELADMVHFHPSDFKLEWFLDVVFGKQPPKESVVAFLKPSDAPAVPSAAAPAAAVPAPAVPKAAKAKAPKAPKAPKGKAAAKNAPAPAAKPAAAPAAPAPAPAASLVEPIALPAASVFDVETVLKFKVPYSYLRRAVPHMSDALKAAIASYEKLDTLLWYHEELHTAEVDQVIARRLGAGEEPQQMSYGKLMERMLYLTLAKSSFTSLLVPIAEKRLRATSLPLDPPVVVLGDASYSMDAAIRTATVIGSLLTALASADLRFFNVVSVPPHVQPRSILQVLDVALKTKADGLTAPACSLLEYYKKKTVVKFFVMVTDEIENIPHENYYFAQLFYKYFTEVYPARIVFVSFLENPKEKGRMVSALESLGIVPLQFRLDSKRPDLTKVDTLLGLLASETEHFCKQTDSLGEMLRKGATVEEVAAAMSKTLQRDGKVPVSEDLSEELAAALRIAAKPSATSATPSPSPAPAAAAVSSSSSAAPAVAAEKKALAQSKGAQDENEQCAVCMQARANTALLECGHLYCESCAGPLVGKACPACRAPVVRTLKVFRL